MVTWLLPLVLGFGTGILSSWGVGGGTLLLLVMTLFLGLEQQTAQGINLLYFLPTAALGLLSHQRNGLLDGTMIRPAALWGTLGALTGALLSTIVSTDVLRRPFGIYLLFSCFVLFRKDRRKAD